MVNVPSVGVPAKGAVVERFVIGSCGVMSALPEVKFGPESVPASYGSSWWTISEIQPLLSRRLSPCVPTNQSGLGAIMVTSVSWLMLEFASKVVET